MILVIGGAYQGKAEYVKNKYDLEPVDCTPWRGLTCKAINNYQNLVRDLVASGADAKEYARKLIEVNPDAVIICDEVGMGIVPMDKGEREYREAVGRSLKILAEASESVVRIYAGIEVIIK